MSTNDSLPAHNKLSVPVVGEQKLPKRGDPVLIMALIFTFLLYSHFLILFKSTLFVSIIKQGVTKEAVNAKIEELSTSN